MKFIGVLLGGFLSLLLATTTSQAGVVLLKAGSSVTITFDDIRPRDKGGPPLAVAGIGAVAVLALDESGTVLTVTLQNASLTNTVAVLYALDLALPNKLVNKARVTANFGGFPDGSNWLGPTDQAALGSFVFAAREAVLKRMDDFLDKQTPLPKGFLQPGQRGKITVTIELPPDTRGPLRLNPAVYLLIPNPQAPLEKRLALVATGAQRLK